MSILYRTLQFLVISLLLISCTKDNPLNAIQTGDPCTRLAGLHAHTFTPVIKGQEILITADSMNGAYYYWSGPGNYSSYAQNSIVSSYADYTNRGWYHVKISYDECDTPVYDSVYVDVKFPQGAATCSPGNNNAVFTSALFLGDQSFGFLSFGAVMGGYGANCSSSNGDMNLTMSQYWVTHDLEDGIYFTTSNQVPEFSDIDKVFISDINESIYWIAEADKPVYISHVGGKQRISFCGVQFSGDWGGTLYHTTVDAQITQP